MILVYPVLTDIPADLDNQKNLANVSGFVFTPPHALRWTPHVQKSVIILPAAVIAVQINANFRNFQLKSFIRPPFNLNPQRIVHIFMGNEASVAHAMKLESVQALRYKIGILSGGPRAGEAVVYKANRLDIFTTVHQFSALSMLNSQSFNAQTYPSETRWIRNGKGESIAGSSFKMTETLSRHYNFTLHLQLDGYQNLGQTANGSWPGFVGNLMADRAQLAFWLSPNLVAHPFHDFTGYVMNMGVGMVTHVPGSVLSWKAILYPFSWHSWLLILLSYLTAAPIFAAYYSGPGEDTITMALDAATRILLQASMEPLPARGRPFVILFSYYALLLAATFNSNLFTFLTFREPERVPFTLEDLVSTAGRNYDVNCIQFKGSVDEAFFRNSKDPAVMDVNSRMKWIPIPRTASALIDMAVNRSSVVFMYSHLSSIYLAQNLTLGRNVPSARVSPTIVSIGSYVAMRKYSKYTEAFADVIARLQERGHVEKWLEEGLEHSRRESIQWFTVLKKAKGRPNLYDNLAYLLQNQRESAKPFSLRHFIFAFTCFATGNSMVILECIVQKVWRRVRHCSR